VDPFSYECPADDQVCAYYYWQCNLASFVLSRTFGWEKQVEARIAEKRKEELKWIWWRKIFYTASMTVK
jgi:hypothetical protein